MFSPAINRKHNKRSEQDDSTYLHPDVGSSSAVSPMLPKGKSPLKPSQFMLGSPVPGKRKDDKDVRIQIPITSKPAFYFLLLMLVTSLLLVLIHQRSYKSYIPFHHPLPPPTENLTFSPTPARRIPPYVHYVYGLSPTFGGKPFGFLQYVCFNSALKILRPERIYFHYVYLPSGWWWRTWLSEIESSSTEFLLVEQRDVKEIFGNKVEHFAHKADVLRLEALRDYGGVYLDSDVLVIKDFGELYKQEMVMAMESQPNLDPELPPSGLCNAVMLATPYSSFVVRWLESYRTFSSSKWAYHSVTLPYLLSQHYPSSITVLNKFAFFWPIWHDDHLRLIHRGTKYDFHKSDRIAPSYDTQFTYHLWESASWERYLKLYNPERIWFKGTAENRGQVREEDGTNDENSFSREARKFVSIELRKKWRQAVEQGEVKEREWEDDKIPVEHVPFESV